ncbi:MAG: hypothetical protein AAB947_00420 [Patescibacteria group bacterium]
MDGGDATLIGVLPNAFGFLGDLLFRWVPATIIYAFNTTQSPPFANLTEPVALWDVSNLLAQASGPVGFEKLVNGWFVFSLITITISIPFLAITLYCWIRIVQIRRGERLAFLAAQRTVAAEDISKTQLRWNRVTEQSGSSNPESWRLAILEADIMLNELLDFQGYKGETIADKMKQVDRMKFNSIESAWDAHKVRNRVAHEGGLTLTPREVRTTIMLYERVFKEFRYIE